MKKYNAIKKLILVAICAFKLGLNAQKNTALKTKPIAPVSNKMMENAVIYEANICQYSTEGTFNAFAKNIPQLKKLVDKKFSN